MVRSGNVALTAAQRVRTPMPNTGTITPNGGLVVAIEPTAMAICANHSPRKSRRVDVGADPVR